MRALITIALLACAASAQAQSPTAPAQATAVADDARWTPWLGCWELVIDDVRDASEGVTPRDRVKADPDETRPQVCVTRAASGGATFTTTIAGETPLAQTTVPDGTDRPVDDAGCRGTQRTDWSRDGTRLYSNAQVRCDGEGMPRRVSGIALLGPDGRWLDIQAVEIGGRENIRLRRYRRVTQNAGAAAPLVTATRLTIGDVKEASARISPRAVEAALVETNARFDLSSRTLLDLDAAGVPASVVDVMVALSYPERFVVERTRDSRVSTVFINDPFFLDYGFAPFDSFYYSPYYYSPFAYSYLGRYDPRIFGGGFVVVDGGGGGRGESEPRPSGTGRVVDGLGYTRVRPREPEPVSSEGRPAASAGGSSTSGSSSSGSGGSATSQGYSGGGGGDTGRTAVQL